MKFSLRTSAVAVGVLCLVGAGSSPVHAQGPGKGVPPTDPNSAPEKTDSSKEQENTAAKTLGYDYGVIYNFSASAGRGSSSNVFQNTEFNSLFGYGVRAKKRHIQGVIFNVTDQASVSSDGEFGRKLLLPTQSGFVFNAFQQHYLDNVDPFEYDDNDHLQSRFGYYVNAGLTPIEFAPTGLTTKASGWLAYSSFGYQYVSPHFRVDKGSIGYTASAGLTTRSLITGFSDQFFWDSIRSEGGNRLRNFIGLEAQFSVDIGDFKPTVQWNYFPQGGDIKNFSGSQISILFNIGQFLSLDKQKGAGVGRIGRYMFNKIERLSKSASYLTDKESKELQGLATSLEPTYHKGSLDRVKEILRKIDDRDFPVSLHPLRPELENLVLDIRFSQSGEATVATVAKLIEDRLLSKGKVEESKQGSKEDKSKTDGKVDVPPAKDKTVTLLTDNDVTVIENLIARLDTVYDKDRLKPLTDALVTLRKDKTTVGHGATELRDLLKELRDDDTKLPLAPPPAPTPTPTPPALAEKL